MATVGKMDRGDAASESGTSQARLSGDAAEPPKPVDGSVRPPLESAEVSPNAPLVEDNAPAPADDDAPEVVELTEIDAVEDDPDSAPPSIPSAASVSSADLDTRRDAEPARTAVPVYPGQLIADRYEVESVLGEGGMGIVYKCRDESNGRMVAVKRVIVPEGGPAHDYLMWFYKEARALAALDHPGIVGAHDFGQLMDGSPYLAMDLVEGVSLHDLAAVRLGFPLIWTLVDQILAAVAHAHARGIIHGDLKPSNVLIEPVAGDAPRVRILDFGLAWLKTDRLDERLDGSKAPEVAPHAGAGTPGYMAPEQIMHEQHNVCGATDLYALGCVLYKILSGRAPFSGTSKELLRLHAFDPVPRLKLIVDAPDAVIDFVLRLLQKRPWDRWEFAAEARTAWAEWRPAASTDPKVWSLPAVAQSVAAPLPSGPTATRTHNPALSPVPERAPGLLSMRPSPLVGRTDIRHRLREICDEVHDGEGEPHRLVLLVGAAGVGKSRIAEWLCEVAHEEGTMVPLRARYRLIRGSLDGMAGAVTQYFNFERVDRDTIEATLLDRWKVGSKDKSGRAWVAGAAEWLRPLGPMSDRPLGPTGMRFTLDTAETRRMVSRYVLRKIANGRPLLYWLDDLHHASPATVDGLLRIHTDEPDQRIVLVATVRAEALRADSPVAERIRTLLDRMNGAAIDTAPLDAETTCTLLKASLPLDSTAAEEAARRSRGNPLFALQQLHAWAIGGNLRLTGGVYTVPDEVLALRPQTTAELWDSRIAAVPEAHRLGATVAAPLGSDLRREVLSDALSSLGLPADQAISSLVNAEILIERRPGRYTWPHALLQEHLLERLEQRSDRQFIYRAAAFALAKLPLAKTRRVVRLRLINMLRAGEPNAAARLLFESLQEAWTGAREPRSALADLELLEGLKGRWLALKNRWSAEALRHVGRPDEAMRYANLARDSFDGLGDRENLGHCLRLLGHLASEQGNSLDGLGLVRQAYEIFRELDDIQGLAQCEAVGGELEYLLGNYEHAREYIQRGEKHFARLGQPLGRGQCLLLFGWIEHSEGATDRARRLTLEARAEFEAAGYRLGIAQADASLAHVEHRVMNFHTAEVGAIDALGAFDSLRTPRGQAACERLLAMIGIDIDDLDMAELHLGRAKKYYDELGDPWGTVETRLLSCQIALVRHQKEDAAARLAECASIEIEEAEPRQHYLLTRAWYQAESGDADSAFESIEAASEIFGERLRAGDHAPHLLSRLSRFTWPTHAMNRIDAWRALLNDRARRKQT